jgi:hypothetical protein
MATMKRFDCVEMKHQAAQKVQACMAGMTVEEKLAYLNQVAAEFRSSGKIPEMPCARHELPPTGTDA